MNRCHNIDIPLWNKTETDILPQYQLSYGHVIFELQDIDLLRRKTEKVLGLVSPEIEYNLLCIKNFPLLGSNAVLYDYEFDHYIYVKTEKYLYLYAKHTLFFNNNLWEKFSKKYKEKIVVCTRGTSTEFGYRIFKDGKFLFCGKNDEKDTIIFANYGMHISFHMDGQKLFKAKDDTPIPIKEDYNMLKFDKYINQINGDVKLFSVNLSTMDNRGNDNFTVLHSVYKNNRHTKKCLFSFFNKMIK